MKKINGTKALLIAGIAATTLASSCSRGKTYSYRVEFSEKELVLELSGYNDNGAFRRVLDSAETVQRQFRDSSLMDIFSDMWEKQYPGTSLYPLFIHYGTRDRISSYMDNRTICYQIRYLMDEAAESAQHVWIGRLEGAGLHVKKDPGRMYPSSHVRRTGCGMYEVDVRLKDEKDTALVERLLTTKGHFEIWEPLTVIKDTALRKALSALSDEPDNAKFHVKSEKVDSIVSRLNDSRFTGVKFMKGLPEKGMTPVYGLENRYKGMAVIDGSSIIQAQSKKNRVSLAFNAEDAKRLSRVTEANIGKPLILAFDDVVYAAPIGQSKIENGKLEILFLSREEADFFAILLIAGRLPINCNIKTIRADGSNGI
jgi:hypothetical protein